MAFGREAIAIDGPLYAYLRKSRSDDPSEPVDVTLRKHRVALEALSKKLQLPISKTFEEVVTGDSLYVRPEMMRLLEAVEAGECGAVLVMDIDRLGRGGMRDQGIILDALSIQGRRSSHPIASMISTTTATRRWLSLRPSSAAESTRRSTRDFNAG